MSQVLRTPWWVCPSSHPDEPGDDLPNNPQGEGTAAVGESQRLAQSHRAGERQSRESKAGPPDSHAQSLPNQWAKEQV